jgi:hypothetical protein
MVIVAQFRGWSNGQESVGSNFICGRFLLTTKNCLPHCSFLNHQLSTINFPDNCLPAKLMPVGPIHQEFSHFGVKRPFGSWLRQRRQAAASKAGRPKRG